MISLEECLGTCVLEFDRVAMIVEQVPEVKAAAMSNYLLHKAERPLHIRQTLIEDIRRAAQRGDYGHAAELFSALRHFIRHHGHEPFSQRARNGREY